MTNNHGTLLLFAEAKILVDEIVFLIDRYNDIAKTLIELGYTLPVQGDSCGWPVPQFRIMANGCSTEDSSDFLDEFWESGPRRVTRQDKTISMRRPMMKERSKLGMASAWTCFYCRGAGDEELGPDRRMWHVDHVYPVAMGGDNKSDNLVLSCATCNLEKKARTAAEYFRELTRVAIQQQEIATRSTPKHEGKEVVAVAREDIRATA